MGMVIRQYDIYLINLDPIVGHAIEKTRPCVVISPDEMNRNIGTVIIAPMTTKSRKYPTRVGIRFQNKSGWIVLDQIRTVYKNRLVRKLGGLEEKNKQQVKDVLQAMLVD